MTLLLARRLKPAKWLPARSCRPLAVRGSGQLGRGSLVTTKPKRSGRNGSCRSALAVGYSNSHSLAHVGVRLAALGGWAEAYGDA